jgi:hypothetical protein
MRRTCSDRVNPIKIVTGHRCALALRPAARRAARANVPRYLYFPHAAVAEHNPLL